MLAVVEAAHRGRQTDRASECVRHWLRYATLRVDGIP